MTIVSEKIHKNSSLQFLPLLPRRDRIFFVATLVHPNGITPFKVILLPGIVFSPRAGFILAKVANFFTFSK
ncbi:MAG: hypothetical protein F6K39_32795 [Okeania sp. SIO3B3]|nr:hypothetical protein [Okeania sp. SIO3B3]